MERRVLIAIFLSFLVLYVYQAVVVKPVPKPGTPGSTAANGPRTGGPTAAGPPAAPPAAAAGTATAAPATPQPPPSQAAAVVTGDAAERDIRIETNTVIAVFTNRGGHLKSWRLKQYRDPQGQ